MMSVYESWICIYHNVGRATCSTKSYTYSYHMIGCLFVCLCILKFQFPSYLHELKLNAKYIIRVCDLYVYVCMWIFIWFSLYACKIFVNLKFPQQFNLLVMIEILWEDFLPLSLSLCVANKSFRVRFCFELNFWIFKSI